jgi:hypothetical protein
MAPVRHRRDIELPLRRNRSFYSSDLRFMARRVRRAGRPLGAVVLYESYGVDHEERRTWVPRFEAPRWAAVLDRLAQLRTSEPLIDLSDPASVVDLRQLRDRIVREPAHPRTLH